MERAAKERYGKEASPFGFEDLETYKAARLFRHRMYVFATDLPHCEVFNLVSQIRRASLSLTNNIAEGYGRHHWQDNCHFCRQARGSLMELVEDLNACLDEGYITQEMHKTCRADAANVLRLLNGYIAYLQRQKNQEK
jgi:four helix bundle protein